MLLLVLNAEFDKRCGLTPSSRVGARSMNRVIAAPTWSR